MKKEKILRLRKKVILLSLLTGVNISLLDNKIVYSNNENNITIEKNDEKKSLGELVSYYSKVFKIKESAIYDALDYNTDGLSNIDEETELKVLDTTRDLYYNPNNYGYESRDNIKIENDYIMTMEIEQAIEKYAKIYGINKEVALSIVYCECGSDVDSANYLENNNPAGLGPHTYFENKEIGVIYFINFLKSIGCTKNSGSEFLYSIASSYSGGEGNLWLDLTIPFYNNLCNDYYYKKPELKNKQNLSDKFNEYKDLYIKDKKYKLI